MAKNVLDKEITKDKTHIRNFAIIAHVDHGKSTLADSILAGANIISMQKAGEQRYLDFDPEEIKRGITINASSISFNYENYWFNLIDTPGHSDFGGKVTKAMRAIDGSLLVVDVVEGIMPQTETVLRQSIYEKVKPLLVINKVDRLFKELLLDLKECQQKLFKLITNINNLIRDITEDPYIELFDFKKGNVILCSALYKWGINSKSSLKNFNLEKVKEYYTEGKESELKTEIPLFMVLMEALIDYFPSPLCAQKHKLNRIWLSEIKTEEYKNIEECNDDCEAIAIVTNITMSSQNNQLVFVRVLCGKLMKGKLIYVDSKLSKPQKIIKTSIVLAKFTEDCEQLSAGEIGVVVGICDVRIGSVLSEKQIELPIENIEHKSEPVVSIAIFPQNLKEMAKLKEIIKLAVLEDNTLLSFYEEETGEHIISGIGKLQLEVLINKITRDNAIKLKIKPPEIVFRETIMSESNVYEDVSSNRHNKFKLSVFRLEEPVVELINKYENFARLKNHQELFAAINIKDPMYYKKILSTESGNILFNATKSVQYLDESLETFIHGFKRAIHKGPLLKKPLTNIGVRLEDATLHIDNVHRTVVHISPPFAKLIHRAILSATPKLLEPIAELTINLPLIYEADVKKQIAKKRGKIINANYELNYVNLIALVPIKEMDDISDKLMAASEGKIFWKHKFLHFDYLPETIATELIEKAEAEKKV